MISPKKTDGAASARIEFACPDEEMVVVRVMGRGCFENSFALRKIPELADRAYGKHAEARKFVVDLEHCQTIDSTFFGVLASLGLRQVKANLGKMVLVNVNKHVHQILDTLGLSKFLEVRDYHPASEAAPTQAYTPAEGEELSKLDRTIVMLEAHQQLGELSEENRLRFRNVIDCLEAALKEERDKGAS